MNMTKTILFLAALTAAGIAFGEKTNETSATSGMKAEMFTIGD